MKLVRLSAAPSLDEILGGYIADVDTAPEADEESIARPWYEPQSAAEVDALVWGCNVKSAGLAERIAALTAEANAVKARRGRIIERYSDLLIAAAPVAADKTYATWRGPFSDGSYRNQPSRAAEIKLLDKDAALAAGPARTRMVIEADTAAIRAADPAVCEKNGVALIPQPAISYSPPK